MKGAKSKNYVKISVGNPVEGGWVVGRFHCYKPTTYTILTDTPDNREVRIE